MAWQSDLDPLQWLASGWHAVDPSHRPLDGQRSVVRREAVSPSGMMHERATVSRHWSQEKVADSGPSVRSADVVLPLAISQTFRPAGYRIGVAAQSLELTPTAGHSHRQLPRFSGSEQKFAVLNLNSGQRYAMVIDGVPGAYRLYVDKNRNGDLRDDGPALVNRSKGLFANSLLLPMAVVTGLRHLEGEYELWFFISQSGWQQGRLHYYVRSQLSGRVALADRVFDAYLADNLLIDGDYRNDGIFIDINGDGKIARQGEYFPPGGPIEINGQRFRLDISN